MNFKDINIKEEYRSPQENIIESFYKPLLNIANKYQRAVGFFSSSSLIEISKGISGLAKNNGKIELIASPRLSEKDVEAIENGIKKKEEVIQEALLAEIKKPKNEYQKNRYNYLINLIASGILEIRIAVLENKNEIGMYHEKLGIMYDNDGNVIAFSGSMNESNIAFSHNYEAIDVFCSWEGGKDANRVENKQIAFESIWNDYEPEIRVIDFPTAVKDKLFQYRLDDVIDYEIDEKEDQDEINNDETEMAKEPSIPLNVSMRDYQLEAIGNWANNGYRGIFDMATGTGKTITGLGAIVRLYQNRKASLAIFIVCPYQHLVDQWVDDIKMFGMKPIICHSASRQKKWKDKLKDQCMLLEFGMEKYMCAVFTNATYCTDFVQNTIRNVKNQSVLVVDEAHNFGADNNSKYLDEKIPYRLALSATLDRQGDEEGTNKLYDYFGEKCIEYTLKEAIENDMLVRYYYHPIVVNFESDELEEYIKISRKIGKAIASSKEGKISESAKLLLVKRARLVAAAQQKVVKLIDELNKIKNDDHILIYCGATTMRDADYVEGNPNDGEKKQVNIVMEKVGNDIGMKVAKFTSEETAEERELLKREFDEGITLQALIAIRCLDEGVNIPSIRKAFILASSTNPKEYIQRRGRVLRKYKGKTHADIYDFIMSPLPIDKIEMFDENTIKYSGSLVKREINRMKDFADLAENSSVADKLIYELINKYNIDVEEDTYGDEY